MMLDGYDSAFLPHNWWDQGGAETAASYAGRPVSVDSDWREMIPRAHIKWLRNLPSIYRDADRKLAFVHAGIDPGRFPLCPEQIRIWTRAERFFDHANWPERDELRDLLVVHGHTPKSFLPEAFAHRINVDTGACFGGP